MQNIKIKPIHPFAARMAPEIAFAVLKDLRKGSTVLDPMSGSGTVLRTVSQYGHNGLGFDIDPLSVMMSKVWTTIYNPKNLLIKSQEIINEAKELKLNSIYLPWIDDSPNTKEFIKFWFARNQSNDLRKLSFVINNYSGKYVDIFKIALSRLIITKSRGASLAGDVSHSRPHRIMVANDFNVFYEFDKTCSYLARIIDNQTLKSNISIKLGDARKLSKVDDGSITSIITSPPYLNALDYMRGHKLSLIWLGYEIDALGNIRSDNVGAEKAPDKGADIAFAQKIIKPIKNIANLTPRQQNMVYRYSLDMYKIVSETERVLENRGMATFVIGNSCINNVYVENSKIIEQSAKIIGLKIKNQKERVIPENKRYLPLPKFSKDSSLSRRMRTEVIMTLVKK